jgi:hypothetical protein
MYLVYIPSNYNQPIFIHSSIANICYNSNHKRTYKRRITLGATSVPLGWLLTRRNASRAPHAVPYDTKTFWSKSDSCIRSIILESAGLCCEMAGYAWEVFTRRQKKSLSKAIREYKKNLVEDE